MKLNFVYLMYILSLYKLSFFDLSLKKCMIFENVFCFVKKKVFLFYCGFVFYFLILVIEFYVFNKIFILYICYIYLLIF